MEDSPDKLQIEINLQWGVKIPLRDGVRLNATVYLPRVMDDPLPAIFTLTPYTADSYHERAAYFARHGYVFLLVDCRGRGNSEGTFVPFENEARDGHDVVEWVADQTWCDGQVAMWGGSYAGYNQWATAREFPPHLATIVPAAAAYAGVDFPFWRNIPFPYEIQWQTLTSGLTDNAALFADDDFWIEQYQHLYRHHLPFRDLPRIVGNTSTVFDTWVQHPIPDAYWDAMEPTAGQFGRIDLPVLTITGHYDDDQPGAMEHYHRHLQHASEAAQKQHYLIIGPWDHAGTRTPKRDVGGLTFGEASLLDLNALHKDWYDWVMKGGKKPEFLKKQVAYYVVPTDEWKYADSLDEIASATRTLYLDSDGRADDAFHAGRLADDPPGDSAPDSYVYDPLDVRHADHEWKDVEARLTDQRYALNLYGAGLVYHSAPFEAYTEVAGYVTLTAWIALDVPDTDFQVILYEILPDGRSVKLTEDMQRARYRESLREEMLVTPGAINEYTFDGFFWFARRVAAGSRLRLVIRAPNTIYLQKNCNSGGVVAEETAADARTAHVTLYHDAEHASVLTLPVVG